MSEEKELWAEVPQFPNDFLVSSFGRVYDINADRFKYQGDKNGYRKIKFSKDGVPYHFLVHRLVAQAFIPNPYNLETVNHKDYNRSNNHISNLEWMTWEDNTRHMNERYYGKKTI